VNLFEDCYLFFRTWRALRPFDETQDMLGGSKIRIREFWARRIFAQPAQILGYSSTRSRRKKDKEIFSRKERKGRKKEL
jgi:hypothetical protein